MEIFLFLLGGFLGGFVFAFLNDVINSTYGIITVDHENNLCRVQITNEDLNNRKTKRAVFKVEHSEKLYDTFEVKNSRDKHTL